MSIEVFSESLLTFSEAAKLLPGRPGISTLHRWRLRGVRGIQLETCLLGGKRFTSREALERFVADSTAAANGERPATRTPRQRKLDIERAEAQVRGKQSKPKCPSEVSAPADGGN